MAAVPAQRKPTFLWQGVLILLPVASLAIASLWTLRLDRAEVQREARQRAGEVIDSLEASLGTRAGVRLALAQLETQHEQKLSFAWLHLDRLPG